MPEALMTPDEVADFLRLKRRTVYALVREGKMPAYRIGGVLRFDRTVVEGWLETQKTKSREELFVGRRPRSRRETARDPHRRDLASFAQPPGPRMGARKSPRTRRESDAAGEGPE